MKLIKLEKPHSQLNKVFWLKADSIEAIEEYSVYCRVYTTAGKTFEIENSSYQDNSDDILEGMIRVDSNTLIDPKRIVAVHISGEEENGDILINLSSNQITASCPIHVLMRKLEEFEEESKFKKERRH